MNGALKEELEVMVVNHISTIIIASRKVSWNHNQLRVVQDEVENLQKKVNAFKAKLWDLFKLGLLSF